MEKDKKYNLVLGLMIFFFVLLVGVCLAWGLGYIGINNKNQSNNDLPNINQENNNNSEENILDNNENINNSNNNNSNNKAETESITSDIKKLSVAEKKELIKANIDVNSYKGKCQQGDCDLYLKAHLPKINLETETVKNINFKLKDIYITANEYYNQDFSANTGADGKYISYTITSKYGYIEKWDCIYIAITKVTGHTHASGSVEYITFMYEVDNDKEVGLKDLLASKNISSADLESKFKASEGYKNAQKNGSDVDGIIKKGLDNYTNIYIHEVTENSISIGIEFNKMDYGIATFAI